MTPASIPTLQDHESSPHRLLSVVGGALQGPLAEPRSHIGGSCHTIRELVTYVTRARIVRHEVTYRMIRTGRGHQKAGKRLLHNHLRAPDASQGHDGDGGA